MKSDVFNQLAGLIFAKMLADFPGRTNLNDREPLREIGYSGNDGRELFYGTVRWLRDEGFMRGTGEIPMHDVTLTARALTILNSIPESVREKRTLADRVSAVSREAGSEAGRSAIGEVVGQIIGAFTKSMAG